MFKAYLEQLFEKLHAMAPSEVVNAYDEYLDNRTEFYENFCESELDRSQMTINAQKRGPDKGTQQYNQESEEQEFIDRICAIKLQPHDHDLIIDVINSRDQDEINYLIDTIDLVVSLSGSLSVKNPANRSDPQKV